MKQPIRSLLLVGAFLLFSGPSLANGYIRVVQDKGVWWFVDGEGKKFFSKGVNCIGGCYGHAEPKPMDAVKKKTILTQLKDWGFNSTGNWSSPSVYGSLYVCDQIYHGVQGWVSDVYDDALWKGNVYPHLADEVKPFVGLKNFVGYFVDNEHKWDDQAVFKLYLGLPAASPGSQKFIAFLRKVSKNDIKALNASLGSSFASFEAIPGSKAPEKYSLASRDAVLKPWRTQTAAYFYGRYVAELRRLDPNHLVLGVRWAGFPDMDLFKAVSAFMDVDSVNDYNRYGNLRPDYGEAYKSTKKPVIITEWSFSGYPKAGEKSLQFIEVYNQENRGIGYHKYVLEAAKAPFMVGMHFFLYNDYDHRWVIKNGNYFPDENMGLVSGDGRVVYTELGKWTKRTHEELDALHAASGHWAPFQPVVPRLAAPKAFSVKIDGDLSDWPAESKRLPQRKEDIHDTPLPKNLYYVGMDKSQLLVAADVDDDSLEETGPDWSWQSDNFTVTMLPEGAGPEKRLNYQLHASGGGKDGKAPYAYRWADGESGVDSTVQLAVAKRPGGWRFEARFPAALLPDFPGKPGATWKLSIAYENISGMNRSWWEGLVSLPKN